MIQVPDRIAKLLVPNGKKPIGRRVWGIDLETVWLPFFTATNALEATRITSDALGAPLRLAYNADSSVKFSKTGRPTVKVAKDIADNVSMVKSNFIADLQNFANTVISEETDRYKQEVEQAQQAGKPIVDRDNGNLQLAYQRQIEQAIAEAEAEGKAEGKHKGKAKAKAEAEPEPVGVVV
jgi:hypothetical protein